jgi:hypothetical protein
MKNYFFITLLITSSLLLSCINQPEVPTESSSDEELEQTQVAVESTESLSVNEDSQLIIPRKEIYKDYDTKVISDPKNGSSTEIGSNIYYVPFIDFNGSDNFKVEYIKQSEVIYTRNIQITVISVNDDPVAINDVASVLSQENIIIDVLANDTDVDENDVLSIQSVGQPLNGVASVEDGKISYQSNAEFSGLETLTYTISDSAGATAEAAIEINVISSGSDEEGLGLPVVPVRIAFIEKSDGTTLTDDYAAYAQNIISDLNDTYTDGEDQKLTYVLDSYDGIVNDDYFVTPSDEYIAALNYFYANHRIIGKVNLFFVNEITGGVAGVAGVNMITTTIGMFEKMPTATLEKNVVGHEVGHNVGFYHTADKQIPDDVMISYTRCNPNVLYFQKSEESYSYHSLVSNGWGYGANLMYPVAKTYPSSLFTSMYDDAFSEIMSCWHQESNWPFEQPQVSN